MPLSRPVPPYLQSPWHPPPTHSVSTPTLTPTTTFHPAPTTVSVLVPVTRLVSVPVERTRLVKRPITLHRPAPGAPPSSLFLSPPSPPTPPSPLKPRTEEWKETGDAGGDVVVDIASPVPSPLSPPTASSSPPPPRLSSLLSPLTSPPPPPRPHPLRRYDLRHALGYAERMQGGSRRLVSVPSETLPPPPFLPPSYPLSTVPPPLDPTSTFPPPLIFLPLATPLPPPLHRCGGHCAAG